MTCSDDYGSSGGSGSPGGLTTQVQFNDAGAFAGDAGLTYNKTADRLTVTYASTTALTATNFFAETWNSYTPANLIALGFSTTSAAYWDSQQFRWATTSTDHWLTTKTTSNFTEGSNLYFTTNRVASVLAGTTTDALDEGSSNLYFTNARADVRVAAGIAATTTTALAEGSNLYFTANRVASALAGTTTDALAQGATNKYYSSLLFASDLAGTTTTALAEGTNKYYTDARADARINATSTVGTLTSAPNLGTVSTSLSGFLKATAGALSTALIDLASNVTGLLPVANGGTGWSNLASGAVLLGNGSGAVSTTTRGSLTETGSSILTVTGGTNALLGSGTTIQVAQSSGSASGFLSSADWTTFNSKQAALGFTPASSTRLISTTYPLQGGGDLSADRTLSLAFGTTTSNSWGGTQTLSNLAATNATSTNLAVSGRLSTLLGTSQYVFNPWSSRLWEIADGTEVSPVSTAGPTFKISRTEAVASTTCNSNNADNECNAALSVISIGLPSTTQQTNAIQAMAQASSIGTDVLGINAVARVTGSGTGNAIGGFFSGRRDTSTGNANGVEINVSNMTNTDGTYNSAGISDTQGIWVSHLSANGRNSGAGLSFGVFPGSGKFLTGIGFTSGSVASTSIRDDSSSDTSIAINGTHTNALTVGSSAGFVGIGTTSPSKLLSIGGGAGTYFDGSGNVGIGISAPARLLHISKNDAAEADNPHLLLQQSGSGDAALQFLLSGAQAWNVGVDNSDNDKFKISSVGDASWTGSRLTIDTSGNVGIGTTTPWRSLSVSGTAAFAGLTGSTGAGSLCLSSNKEVVYNSASDSCLSSTRATKHEIQNLDLAALTIVQSLQPVSFIYNNDASSTVRYGFIAEDAAAVDQHLTTHDQTGAVSGIDDRAVISVVVKAVQQLARELRDVASAVTGFAQRFTTQELCVGSTCVTESQFRAMVAAANQTSTPAGTTSGGDSTSTAPDTTPPVITINGSNPATIHVGDTYADLGATVTDNVDNNLGYKTFLNGALVSNIMIDTSAAATDTIDYVASDSAGNTATSTRTVIVETTETGTVVTTTEAATTTEAI